MCGPKRYGFSADLVITKLSNHRVTEDSVVLKGQFVGLDWNRIAWLLIRGLKPALNETVGSEKLSLYYFADVVYFAHCCLASYHWSTLL